MAEWPQYWKLLNPLLVRISLVFLKLLYEYIVLFLEIFLSYEMKPCCKGKNNLQDARRLISSKIYQNC